MSLMPDDNSQEPLDLSPHAARAGQPYGATAVMITLSVALVARMLVGSRPMLPFLLGAVVVGIAAYVLLTTFRPQLPLLFLSIIAAELGLLLSLPAGEFFISPMRHFALLVVLVSQMIGAGAIGLFLGWALAIERNPELVLAVNFFLLFVIAGFRGMLM